MVGGFVFLLILWAIFRYRRRSEEMPKQTQYHTLLEIVYTVVPIIIVLVLFVFTVLAENKVDATPARSGRHHHRQRLPVGLGVRVPRRPGFGLRQPLVPHGKPESTASR